MAGTEKRNLIILPAARHDLEQIWLYTRDMWSTAQAIAYTDSLNQQFLHLCDLPEMGRRYPHFAPDIRLLVRTKHIIIYKLSDQTIQIMRVLGSQQDWLSIVRRLDP